MPQNINSKTSQANIKNENMKAIFSYIASSDGISRAEIAQKTSLSLMTVGKVADLLIERGLVTQAKPATGNAGRRAGMLEVSDKLFILCFDLSTPKFRASAINLRLCSFDSLTYQYNDTLFPEDNLIIFFRKASSFLMRHLAEKTLIGTGICVPGEYDEEKDTIIAPRMKELDGLKIADTMKKSIGFAPNKIMNNVTAAALSEFSCLPDDKKGSVISLSLDGGVVGCFAIDGKIFPRRSDFESIMCENGKTLGAVLSSANSYDEDTLCHLVVSSISPIISVLCPDAIFMSSNERNFSESFRQKLCELISSKAKNTQVIFENRKEYRSEMGIAEWIRNEKFNEMGNKIENRFI
ncbi:MAG: ROK family protein [Clostridia bacterium]|nr:ROK family protein [Clostridia bacterium]